MYTMITQVAWQYPNIGDDDQFSYQVASSFIRRFVADYYALHNKNHGHPLHPGLAPDVLPLDPVRSGRESSLRASPSL